MPCPVTRLGLILLWTAACGTAGPDDPADQADAGFVAFGQDTDGDGLDDAFESNAGALAHLDPTRPDTDGDGTADGLEDPDQDGLNNAQEQAAGQRPSLPAGSVPHPLRVDVLVEVDLMAGITVQDAMFDAAAAAFAALPMAGVGGQSGVGLHFFVDESTIAARDFDGSGEERTSFLRDHGPRFSAPSGFPAAEMVHVMVAQQRTDRPTLPAETLFLPGSDVESTGVIIYQHAIDDAHPACSGEIQMEDALVAAFVHELGHTLQLGHDTEVGGGVNIFNIMALAGNCAQAIQRFHGTGNTNPALGNTESINASRFSNAAAALMRFTNKLSVDTAALVDDDGVEM